MHEVAAPTAWAVCHPKLWILRYVATGAAPRFRIVCSSRNLTFDHSWDTVLVLDGEAGAAVPTPGLDPLVRSLPSLCVTPLPAARKRSLDEFAAELATVHFEPPDGFDDVRFHTIGLDGPTWPLPSELDRLLVVSPFLTGSSVERLADSARETTVLSRPESFDALDPSLLARLAKRYVLDPAAVVGADTDDGGDRSLRGLHAKVYVTERRLDVNWYIGSANATGAAFGGNVEVLAELTGKRKRVGIGSVLGPDDAGLLRMLAEHPASVSATEPTDEQAVDGDLDDLRRHLASAPLQVAVAEVADGYTLTLSGSWGATIEPGDVAVVLLRPLSLMGQQAIHLGRPFSVAFGPAAFESITPFVVAEITIRRGKTTRSATFVVQAELIDAPDDRDDRLLASMFANRRDVLRYLLFLLSDSAESSSPAWLQIVGRLADPEEDGDDGSGAIGLPLLEVLVRAASRDPKQLERVDRLVSSLQRTPEGAALLPSGFIDVWPAVWAAASEAVR
jgi:hypothetical protein